ncbi:helix-turn-helix domain-containing protein [Nocardia sp. NBC_01499]|uniref:helix-turn-helix domain-containing protein n=1 Tax=Nocardia sp. NBC_01499 TaxID=2903597 RepID=UPI003868933F
MATGWSLDELATRARRSPSSLSRIENGQWGSDRTAHLSSAALGAGSTDAPASAKCSAGMSTPAP